MLLVTNQPPQEKEHTDSNDAEGALMEQIARQSMQAYRSLIEDPGSVGLVHPDHADCAHQPATHCIKTGISEVCFRSGF